MLTITTLVMAIYEYFYIFTEKVHQYDVQCIMTGGLFSCHQEVKKEPTRRHFCSVRVLSLRLVK